MNLQELSVSEKILLAEQLWESARSEAASLPLSVQQQQVLDERLAAFQLDGDAGDVWDVVKKRIQGC